MFRFLLLLLLAGAGPAAAYSYTLARPTPVSSVPASFYRPALPDGSGPAVAVPAGICTTADTVQALHCLFRQQRRKGNLIIGISFATHVALSAIFAILESNSIQRSRATSGGGGGGFTIRGPLLQFGFIGHLLVFSLIFVPITAVGIRYAIAYSEIREKRLVGRYEAAHRLPARFRRQAAPYLP